MSPLSSGRTSLLSLAHFLRCQRWNVVSDVSLLTGHLRRTKDTESNHDSRVDIDKKIGVLLGYSVHDHARDRIQLTPLTPCFSKPRGEFLCGLLVDFTLNLGPSDRGTKIGVICGVLFTQ